MALKVNKGGRPPKLTPDDKTLATVEAVASIMATTKEAAAVLKVDEKTFIKFRKDHPQVEERWLRGKEGGKVSLRRKQFALADRNATMAIFLGLNYLGQKDRREIGGYGGGPVQIDIKNLTSLQLEQFKERLVADLTAKGQLRPSPARGG